MTSPSRLYLTLQLRNRSFHKYTHHLPLVPFRTAKIRERRDLRVNRAQHLVNDGIAQVLPLRKLESLYEGRYRCYTTHGQSQVSTTTVCLGKQNSDAQTGPVIGGKRAVFEIGRPTLLGHERNLDVDENLARLQCRFVHAPKKILQPYRPRTIRAKNADFGVQDEHRGWRVETIIGVRKIAADGRGLPDTNVADFAEGFSNDGNEVPHHRRTFHGAVRDERTDTNPVPFLRDPIEPRYRLQIHEAGIMNRPLFHQNNQRRSTGNRTGCVAILDQKLTGFSERIRL